MTSLNYVTMPRTNLVFLLLLLFYTDTKQVDPEREQFCKEVEQCESDDTKVCGIRLEGDLYHLKTFPDECELLKYGCEVEEKDAYGIINMRYCTSTSSIITNSSITTNETATANKCIEQCSAQIETVCGIRRHGAGFKVRLFVNECEMKNYNCLKNLTFNATDNFICDGLELSDDAPQNLTTKPVLNLLNATQLTKTLGLESKEATAVEHTATIKPVVEVRPPKRTKNVIVVDANMFASSNSINDSIDNFFSATHVFDMPLKDVTHNLDEKTRRMVVRVFGPVVVYKPSINIPKNISTDVWHSPTLASCYHRCPVECPDTYAPVCGMPGQTIAREPSLMFRNHCFMDAAQCHMRWANESYTAVSSSYTESSFYFCVGDTLNGLYRFLPLIRTLQHMGRLKRKGRFRTRLRNMRFFNELLQISPKLMG